MQKTETESAKTEQPVKMNFNKIIPLLKSEKYANLRACSSDMYATFISFEFSDLSNGSIY